MVIDITNRLYEWFWNVVEKTPDGYDLGQNLIFSSTRIENSLTSVTQIIIPQEQSSEIVTIPNYIWCAEIFC